MYLYNCHIENFGKLHDATLDFTENPTVICRENEWGKSTLAAFIRVMFYGFENENKRGNALERERVYYKPWQGGAYGGELEFGIGGKRYRMNRTFGAKETEDTFTLYDGATGIPSNDFSAKIGEELFRINSEAFRRTVFAAQNDCVTATTDSINAKLGNLAETMDDLGRYEAAQARIRDEMNALSPTRKTGSIRKQKEEIAGIRSELRGRGAAETAARELNAKLAAVRTERESLLVRRDALREEETRANAYQALAAKKAHYQALLRQRDERKAAADEALRGMGGNTSGNASENAEQTINTYLRQWKNCEEREADLAVKQDVLSDKRAALEAARSEKRGGYLGILLAIAVMIAGIALFLAGYEPLGAGVASAGVAWMVIFMLRGSAARKQAKARTEEQERDLAALEQEIRDEENRLDGLENEILAYLERNGFPAIGNEAVREKLYELKNACQLYRTLEAQLRSGEQAVEQFERENDVTKFREAEPDLTRTPDEIRGELRQCEAALEQSHRTEDAYQAQLEGVQTELEQLEEQAEALETLVTECDEETRRYRDLELTATYLTRAKELFTAQYTEPITRAYRKYYELLDGCSGEEYRMDANIHMTRREAGEQREIRSLSAGSRDLTGICLRMALIDAMYPDEKPFVILDDSFVNLDDERLAHAKRFLSEVAKEYQVLYFTCHAQ